MVFVRHGQCAALQFIFWPGNHFIISKNSNLCEYFISINPNNHKMWKSSFLLCIHLKKLRPALAYFLSYIFGTRANKSGHHCYLIITYSCQILESKTQTSLASHRNKLKYITCYTADFFESFPNLRFFNKTKVSNFVNKHEVFNALRNVM